MNEEIKVGDWITSKSYGEAVCIGIEGDWYQLRYHAAHCADQKEMWVQNGEHKDYVTYLGPTTETAQYVLTLKGTYGDGETLPRNRFR